MPATDLLTLEQDAIVTLFAVDLTPCGQPTILRFCNSSETNGVSPKFGGLTYAAYPISSTGYEQSSSGPLPAPSLSVANLDGSISALILQLDGCIGAKVTRTKTLAKYLDGRPTANSNEILSQDTYYVSRYEENALIVTFTLKHPLDLFGLTLPRRRIGSL